MKKLPRNEVTKKKETLNNIYLNIEFTFGAGAGAACKGYDYYDHGDFFSWETFSTTLVFHVWDKGWKFFAEILAFI